MPSWKEVQQTKMDKSIDKMKRSEIVKVFHEKSIFLTGATGYLGQMLLEKLLRTCNTLNKIYILVRMKTGKAIDTRYEEIFMEPIWEPLRKENPKFREKVFLISGDLLLPNLGMQEESIEILKNEVNIILHCAATVRFDQHIKKAAYINVRAVRDLLEIAKDAKKLEVFLHVSTAFSHAPRSVIDEVFYEPPISPENLLQLVEILSEEKLAEITPILLEEWPNTYTFTKAVAENLVKKMGNELPLVMSRPSIVIAALTEPLPGWINNIYGPTGLFLATGLGVLRVLRSDPKIMVDIVPSDYVINSMIAAVAERYNMKTNKKISADNSLPVPIFTYSNSEQASISIDTMIKLITEAALKIPSIHCIWHATYVFTRNKFQHNIAVFFLHTIPAHVIDVILKLVGKTPQAVGNYKKIDKVTDVLAYFTSGQWRFKNDNTKRLWDDLNEIDRKLFPFSMENFDWSGYMDKYSRGVRLFILKEPFDTIPEGERRIYLLKIAHYSLLSVLTFIFIFVLRLIFKFLW